MAEYQIDVTTSGSAGSAAGAERTDVPVRGFVYAIKIDYDGSAPGSTTVELVEEGGLAQTIVDLGAGNSDLILYPRVQETQNDNTPTGAHGFYFVDGRYLSLSVSNSDPLANAVRATIQVLE
ncbi:MAG: hypothetical protein KC708_04680 [Anaerolineae bacterium]|nr:hypothetical protein [Anaerolineae bacterium]